MKHTSGELVGQIFNCLKFQYMLLLLIMGFYDNACAGTTVLSYVNVVCAGLRHSIPKSIVYCQVREAKRSLLDLYYTELGKLEVGNDSLLSSSVFSY